MLSAGMFSAFAAAMAVRNRGFESASPPPFLAAMVISLISRVKILPRLASSAPFLCLIVAHFEWPDIAGTSDVEKLGISTETLLRLCCIATVHQGKPQDRVESRAPQCRPLQDRRVKENYIP